MSIFQINIITINGTDLKKNQGVALVTSNVPEDAKNVEVDARYLLTVFIKKDEPGSLARSSFKIDIKSTPPPPKKKV